MACQITIKIAAIYAVRASPLVGGRRSQSAAIAILRIPEKYGMFASNEYLC
jgi:hypothetical protein